jgi:predicted nuclease of predicted toxin-antitoxin system
MKIKLDENLPEDLVATLSSLGHDADTVVQEGLKGQSDPAVWAAAQQAQRLFITQDIDFADIRRFAPGTHHGLMLVRLNSSGLFSLMSRLESVFRKEPVDTWSGCFIVVTDRKVRVRRTT